MSGPGGGPDQLPGSDQPPGAAESEAFDLAANAKDTCEENKNQLESLKEIMLRTKESLKKKEEEVEEYGKKLSKIKSRAKLSRRSRDAAPSVEVTPEAGVKSRISSPRVVNFDESVDDISQAKTPKAKSSLLQKKLAENRKIFEQRSREMTENKRAVEEKVEAIRQQLDESDTTILELQKELSTVVPVQPVVITTQLASQSLQHFNVQDKDNRIAELSNKVLQLEATVLDLQENLKEKDSVIDSKTKAITLMSADLSKKSKSTLDTLEDTKDEMRTMQSNFVLIETSLKQKIDSLLQQLQGRDGQIAEYEDTVEGLKEDLEKRRITDAATADFSRSTLDTLAETKDAMKSMQENFILIESSLKSKVNNLLEQLEERETKLAEAEEKIFKLESGAGIVASPDVKELQSKLEIIEQRNRQLQDEKYELQKSLAALQNKVISNEPVVSNGLIAEKDNRIAELENLIEELRKSNQLLLEESKTELQNQIVELTSRNEEYSNKVNDLEKLVHDLETEKNELVKRIPEESEESREDARVVKLTKELDELNKGMIKLKAQHKSKVKSLQQQLESFKKVSDANAELVKLGNQVTLLEEEKGNLQLSLVDFDELKASAGDWQERIADLETKISAQSSEIDSQVQAIATLENQKLDLMQELHTVKQEVSALEAENAESENLRVTAEMKVVELEEQLDALQKSVAEPKPSETPNKSELKQYLDKIESLSQENNNLIVKLAKLEEKGTSDAGSTESFETLHETDRNELLKKIDLLTHENNDLIIKLTKLEERTSSTDSFEALNDSNKNELLKKIDQLAQENNNLIVKLAKLEEKSSSDSGSTESFDRIPEHVDHHSRLDVLTQENNELVIKLIKLEEKLAQIEDSPDHGPKSEATKESEVFDMENRIYALTQENNDLVIQLTKLQEKIGDQLSVSPEIDELQERVKVLTEENNDLVIKVTKMGEANESLKISLDLVTKERDGLKDKVEDVIANPSATELIEKLNELNRRNATSARGICEELSKLLRKLTDERTEVEDLSIPKESDSVTLLEKEIESCKKLISEQTEVIDDIKSKLSEKQEELDLQAKKIADHQATGEDLNKLRLELKDSLGVIEEWKFKCNEMEEKMKILEFEKTSIEDGLRILEAEHEGLMKQSDAKDLETVKLKKELDQTISLFESKLQEEIKLASARETEIATLKEIIASKDADLHDKYEKLQKDMITIDSLQDDLNNYKTQIEDQKNTIDSLRKEIESLNATLLINNEEISNAKAEIQKLNEELENSKSYEEFDGVVKNLNDNQEIIKQMQKKIGEQADENLNASNQIENMNSNIRNVEEQLIIKQEEIARLMETNEYLEEELNRAKAIELSTTNEISHLQNTLEQNNVYVEDLRKELSNVYKKLEQVKSQHNEDSAMQNRRLEELFEELNKKIHENENLKSLLEDRNKLLSQNLAEETKLALESHVADLEKKLMDSETKGKAQLDKMKKIAANLKKKAARCQDLEAEVSTLEEKWNTEKSEKEAMNKSLQENESVIREKDNQISELEKRVSESQNQASMALENVKGLVQEIDVSKEKLNSLLEQVTEMGEEIEKLRSEINAKNIELEDERTTKLNVSSEYQAYKIQIEADYQKQQIDLEEASERARELRVRMEVMESEYVEQLSLIQKLKAENGMLSSKETQINEKLENVEKESEERKYLLEKLQKEKLDVIEKIEAHKAQSLDCELRETAVSQESREQVHTSLQALQAKLQERDAVVESLETELGKANERVNKLEEALVAVEERRYSLEKRTELLGAELEQSFRITEEASFSEDMLEQRLATLMAKDEAINEKLNETVDENNELTQKIKSLQDLNISLQERIEAVEEELKYGREANEKLQNIDVLYSELIEKHNQLEIELKKTQQELHSAKQHIDSSEQEVTLQINQLDGERKHLLETCEKLEDQKANLIQEIESLKDGVTLCRQRISELEAEVETLREVNGQLATEVSNRKELSVAQGTDCNEDVERLKTLLAEKDIEIENYQRRNMQLQMAAFDAPKSFDVSNVFGTSVASSASVPDDEVGRLTKLLSEKEQQYVDVCSELDNVKQRLTEFESEYEKTLNEKDQHYQQLMTDSENLQTEYYRCRNELIGLNEIVSAKNAEINSLIIQLGDSGMQLEMHVNNRRGYEGEISRLSEIVASKDGEIQKIRDELSSVSEALSKIDSSAIENDNLIDDKNTLINQLENVKSIYESQLDELKSQQQEAAEVVDQIISAAEQKVNKFYQTQDEKADAGPPGLRKVASTFNQLLADFDTVKLEKEELLRSQESYKIEVAKLKEQLAHHLDDGNSKRVQELENQLVELSQKKKALQESEKQELLINELKKQLDEILAEKQSLENQVSSLTTTINQLRSKQPQIVISNDPENATLRSSTIEETLEKTVKLDLGSEWDAGSTGKLDNEEEGWGWGAEDAQLEDEHLQTASLTPSVEIQLQTRVAELEDQLKDLESKRNILEEEGKAAQLKVVKLVKKLKEFKIQNEMLQRNINQQQSASMFSDLDSAIEEELKSQIDKLEKSLKDALQEQKKTVGEKEHLQKRLEVLTAANERFVEMKERQDMDVEVLQIRNKELMNKIQSLEWQLQEMSSRTGQEEYSMPSSQTESRVSPPQNKPDHPSGKTSASNDQADQLCERYKEEIDDLKEEMEALATENEQLQLLLEEQKAQKASAETNSSTAQTDGVDLAEMMEQNVTLQTTLSKVQEECNLLIKQYEQSITEMNEQVTAMRKDNDLQKAEQSEWTLRVTELQRDLERVKQENMELLQKVEILNSTEDKLSSVSISLAEVTELLNARVQEVADLKQNYQQQYLERTEAENDLRSNIEELNRQLSEKQEEIANLRQSLIEKENSNAQQQTVEMNALQIELLTKEQELEQLRYSLTNKESSVQRCNLELEEGMLRIEELQRENERLKTTLVERESSLEKANAELTIRYEESAEKESYLEWYKAQLPKYTTELEKRQAEINELKDLIANQSTSETDAASPKTHSLEINDKEKEIEDLKMALQEKNSLNEWYNQETQKWSEELNRVNLEVSHLKEEVESKNIQLERLSNFLIEKETVIEKVKQQLDEKQREIHSFDQFKPESQKQQSVALADSFPRFKMASDDDFQLRTSIDELKSKLKEKEEQIEHFEYMLNENTYPELVQKLQDNINQLHTDKYQAEQSFEGKIQSLNEQLAAKQTEIEKLKQQLEVGQHERVSKENYELSLLERSLPSDQEAIARLQNELHAKEQEINELRYVIAEKDSQISMQASSNPQFDEYEVQETLQRLNGELYAKQQEIELLRITLLEKEKAIEDIKASKSMSEEQENLISKLTAEKESIKEEADRLLQSRHAEKEAEIDSLKKRLAEENKELLESLQLKDTDITNLRIQMEQLTADHDESLHDKHEELLVVKTDLAEKERRLAEVSITKDAEIHNLRVQIHDKDIRIEELTALSEEEERQLNELREIVESREKEINNLKALLAETVQEYETIQKSLLKGTSLGSVDSTPVKSGIEQTTAIESPSDKGESTIPLLGVVSVEGELDLALYMLHQRDVRCEELTLELMQLLEERDTLQLRLSNAIRVNEDLRRQRPAASSPKKEPLASTSSDEPLVEHPSPTKTDGPVEIAREALDIQSAPIEEDKDILAKKLSELHTVHQRRDVTLCDERESRHTQQMSFVARRDMLNSLPPEAAARLVNANYTLSRDVQSQSSVLLNWLWGKSTPKVMHM